MSGVRLILLLDCLPVLVYLIDKYHPLLLAGQLQHPLDHIVPILVLDQVIQTQVVLVGGGSGCHIVDVLLQVDLGIGDFAHQVVSLLLVPVLEALLDDVAAELVQTQLQHPLPHLVDDELLVRGLPVLEHVRDHVVAVLVLGQIEHPLEDLVQDGSDLLLLAVLQHPLDDPAPVLVHTHLVDPSLERVNDELHLRTVDLLHYLLYHVVPIGILNTLVHPRPHLVDQHVPLIGRQHLKSLLHHAAPVLV